MSFGASLSDAVLLTQLAWNTVRNAQKACGEYDDLTQQVSALHVVLRRFQKEASVAEGEDRSEGPDREQPNAYNDEIQAVVSGCGKVLSTLEKILKKYNGLGESERDGRSKMLWKKVRFGNGEMADLGELRGKVVYHTSLLTLFLNLRSTGSIGLVEQQMNDVGGHLKEIKAIVNGIAAAQISHEGSILSAYTDDDRSAWRDIRRELRHKHGFRDADLREYKPLIIEYLRELGDRGVLDDNDEKNPREDEEGGAVNQYEDNAGLRTSLIANELPNTSSHGSRYTRQALTRRSTRQIESAMRDDAQHDSESQALSSFGSEDGFLDQDRDLAILGDEISIKSFNVVRRRFNHDYVPQCQEFLWAPPQDEESSEERCRLLSDAILTNVLLELGPVGSEGNDGSDSLKAKKIELVNQVQIWLAKLDEAAKENTTEWLVELCDELCCGVVKQIMGINSGINLGKDEKKEIYAMMEKKISQGLIRLDDIYVDGFPGLRIIKGNLKGDLKAMQKAVRQIKKNSKWSWWDIRSPTNATQIPRVELEFNRVPRMITSGNSANVELIRPSTLEWSRMKKCPQNACISCRRILCHSFHIRISSCDHNWCTPCMRLLIGLSTRDPDFKPPKCCTNRPIALQPVAKLFDSAFNKTRDREYQKITDELTTYCSGAYCGKPTELWDFCYWSADGNRYEPHALCPKCQSPGIPLSNRCGDG